ncbi:type II toxin-antitoxin system RelE/ParE family toxin [Rhizobium tropici]|uniref:Type II toxin-antitoxin system RelE/ParE family toxin n=1 Tax=Rhizobium tropici TaxID=398 RepID=A0A5B0W9P9_RHITR|nr:type II toxin-antitoxin system RelE/ParE family toxin [Rhizobium tropici]KAA1183770.1 type II toxin-antitoxin system RelE/ParE family toxin [Rhizobium tropici]
MDYYIRLHKLAEAELDQIFDDMTANVGPAIAGNYVGGIYELIEGLATFAERGTVREGPVLGLRIIGYRRTASIAFVVEGDQVTVLGVFRRGRNVTADMLRNRL